MAQNILRLTCNEITVDSEINDKGISVPVSCKDLGFPNGIPSGTVIQQEIIEQEKVVFERSFQMPYIAHDITSVNLDILLGLSTTDISFRGKGKKVQTQYEFLQARKKVLWEALREARKRNPTMLALPNVTIPENKNE